MMDGRRKEWWGRGERGQGGEGSHLPSIFTGSELLNWELELERVPETLQIQLHLLDIGGQLSGDNTSQFLPTPQNNLGTGY